MPPRARPRSGSPGRRQRQGRGVTWRPVAGLAVVLLVAAVGYYAETHREACCDPCPRDAGQIDIAYGVRNNSPVPFLPDEITGLLTAASDAEKPIVMYRVDGEPTEALRRRFHSETRATLPREQEIESFVDEIVTALVDIRPLQEEAAPLEALTLAARDTKPGDTVVLIDSGLQTVAPLNFVTPGLLLAEPPDVVASLANAHAIPDLAGRQLFLMSIGDTVSPQPALDGNRKNNLLAIWQAIAKASGATCVRTLTYPPRDGQLVGAPKVALVPMPEPPPPCGDIVLYNGDAVGFEPESDRFLDREGAKAFLRPYAETIVGDRRAHLIGTTARVGPPEGQRKLGQRRADRVKELFAELGAAAGRITTEGLGSYSTFYHNDLGPDGHLLPGPAALNRSVVLQIVCGNPA